MKYDYFVVGSELEWIYDKCDDKLVNSSDDKRLEALWKIKRQDRQAWRGRTGCSCYSLWGRKVFYGTEGNHCNLESEVLSRRSQHK